MKMHFADKWGSLGGVSIGTSAVVHADTGQMYDRQHGLTIVYPIRHTVKDYGPSLSFYEVPAFNGFHSVDHVKIEGSVVNAPQDYGCYESSNLNWYSKAHKWGLVAPYGETVFSQTDPIPYKDWLGWRANIFRLATVQFVYVDYIDGYCITAAGSYTWIDEDDRKYGSTPTRNSGYFTISSGNLSFRKLSDFTEQNGKLSYRERSYKLSGGVVESFNVSQISQLQSVLRRVVIGSLPLVQSEPWLDRRLTVATVQGHTVRCPQTVQLSAVFPESRRNPRWGDLAAEAYQNVDASFDGNGIALLSDIAKLGASARSTLRTIESLGSRKAKAVASLFLSFHYGWKLLAMDVGELCEAFQKLDSMTELSRCQAAEQWQDGNATYNCRYQCWFRPFGNVADYWRRLSYLLDLSLTLENIWDLVPYSFVVDWFVDVSDACSALDGYYTLTQRHDVVCASQSIKAVWRGNPEKLGFTGLSGECTYSWYTRQYRNSPILPTFLPQPTDRAHPLNHFIEGSALVISKR